MEVEKNEEGTLVNEKINEEIAIVEEKPQENEKPVIKVKKPRTEKQKEALKKMLERRREMAVVQRTERKERRAPKWYRELNTQQKEIDELKEVINKLKEQSIAPKESQTVEDEVEEQVYGLKDDVYYPPPVIRQPVYKEVRPIRNFTPNDKISLLRHLV
jgi:adenylate kinase family enzyme